MWSVWSLIQNIWHCNILCIAITLIYIATEVRNRPLFSVNAHNWGLESWIWIKKMYSKNQSKFRKNLQWKLRSNIVPVGIVKTCLDWKTFQNYVPWQVLILEKYASEFWSWLSFFFLNLLKIKSRAFLSWRFVFFIMFGAALFF